MNALATLWQAVPASLTAAGHDPVAAQRLAGAVLRAAQASAATEVDDDDWLVLPQEDGLLVSGPDLVVTVQGPPAAPGRIEVAAGGRLLYITDAVPGVLAAEAAGAAQGRHEPGTIDGVHVHVRICEGPTTMVDASFPAGEDPEDHLDVSATSRRMEQRIRQIVARAPKEGLDGPVEPTLRPSATPTQAAPSTPPVPSSPPTPAIPPTAEPSPSAPPSAPPPSAPSPPPRPTWQPTHTISGAAQQPAWASAMRGETRSWWLAPGEPVRLIQVDEGWAQFEDRHRRLGWTRPGHLQEVSRELPHGPWRATHRTMAATGVWPRPDPRWRPVDQVAAGWLVRLLDVHLGWAHVDVASGHAGWIDVSLLDALEGGIAH